MSAPSSFWKTDGEGLVAIERNSKRCRESNKKQITVRPEWDLIYRNFSTHYCVACWKTCVVDIDLSARLYRSLAWGCACTSYYFKRNKHIDGTLSAFTWVACTMSKENSTSRRACNVSRSLWTLLSAVRLKVERHGKFKTAHRKRVCFRPHTTDVYYNFSFTKKGVHFSSQNVFIYFFEFTVFFPSRNTPAVFPPNGIFLESFCSRN